MSQADSLENLVRPLLELLESVTGLESTYLTTVDLQAGMQRILYARNTSSLQIPEGTAVAWEDTLCKRALDEGLRHTDDVPAIWADSAAAKALGIMTYASTPVHTPDGTLVGTLCAASDERKPLPTGADRVLDMFSHLIAQQVERERLIRELREANRLLSATALTDEGTRLPNRRALLAEMRRRRQDASSASMELLVGYIDLDRFKHINDTHGHDTGDHFLRAMSARLRRALRGDDFVARIGGDEFVVLSSVPPRQVDKALSSLRERLRRTTRGRFHLDAVVLEYAGPSIEVVVAPREVEDPESVLARADAAMYEVKRARHAQR
ncbi:diguanylate cyclase [Oleiagrimonas soli]|uniref:Diguanylate cyclase n=1 Tax=Oleiagrimonas soli TaxID=1543381 RepID=A0A099CZD9_9GAMM|nr:diguanylate cyclase [Oleiagrimonas soli]